MANLAPESPASEEGEALQGKASTSENSPKEDLVTKPKQDLAAKPKPEPKPDVWASTAVLGLFGFALTTMCIGLATTGNLGIDAVPGLSMAAAFGGTGQFIAGLIQLRRGDIFAGTVFTCYGCFWWSVFFLDVVMPWFGHSPAGNDMLIFWWMWTLVTTTFLISSWKHGPGICATFVILIIAFLLLDIKQHLAIHETNDTDLNKAVGWIIFLCGLCAWATGTAVMTNNQYGRVIIPL